MTKSYYASYRAVPPHATIIGGVRSARTSRYDSRSDAEYRLSDVIAVNGGPSVCDGVVVESIDYPEIFLHCGQHATAIGCFCPGCRAMMTKEHARKAVPRP